MGDILTDNLFTNFDFIIIVAKKSKFWLKQKTQIFMRVKFTDDGIIKY